MYSEKVLIDQNCTCQNCEPIECIYDRKVNQIS